MNERTSGCLTGAIVYQVRTPSVLTPPCMGDVEDQGKFKYMALRTLYCEILDCTIPNPQDHHDPTDLETEIWVAPI
jgi:hypothetical protein